MMQALPVSPRKSEGSLKVSSLPVLSHTCSCPGLLLSSCHPLFLLPSPHKPSSVASSSHSSHLCRRYYWPTAESWLFWKLLWEMDGVVFCPTWNWEHIIANCSWTLTVTCSWNYMCSEQRAAPKRYIYFHRLAAHKHQDRPYRMCCPLATGRPIDGIFFADYKSVLALLGNAISARVKTMQTVKPKNLQCCEAWAVYLQA